MGTSSQKNRTSSSDKNEGFLRSFNSSLEGPIQQHLAQVYTCLMISTLAATAGACFHLVLTNILSENLLPFLIGVAFMMTLSKTPDESGKNVKTRIGLLVGFSFFTGLGLGPLLGIVININPAIIAIAFLYTSLIFARFSVVCVAFALMFPRGQNSFLEGPLLSLLLLLTNALVSYYFIGSMLLFEFYLNMGFAVVCGLVLYDTHRIIEKHRQGDNDYTSHSTDLFNNVFVDIFGSLKSILAKKEEGDKNSKKRKD